MVSKPKNTVGDRHLARKSMHLARNLDFGRSHQMSVVACSNASSAECNISVYFFPVPSTRCAHHACINLMYTCFHSNIHALRVFLVCISWIRVAVAVAVAVTEIAYRSLKKEHACNTAHSRTSHRWLARSRISVAVGDRILLHAATAQIC